MRPMDLPRRTDLILRREAAAMVAMPPSLLARWEPHPEDGEASILSWSLARLDPFSSTPTILQALNRLRMLAGLAPLRMQADGTIDMPEEPSQDSLDYEPTPFVA